MTTINQGVRIANVKDVEEIWRHEFFKIGIEESLDVFGLSFVRIEEGIELSF